MYSLHVILVVAVTDVGMISMLDTFMKSNSANAVSVVVFNLDTNQWEFASPVHRQAAVRCP